MTAFFIKFLIYYSLIIDYHYTLDNRLSKGSLNKARINIDTMFSVNLYITQLIAQNVGILLCFFFIKLIK